jgi:hypothetical protein
MYYYNIQFFDSRLTEALEIEGVSKKTNGCKELRIKLKEVIREKNFCVKSFLKSFIDD